MDSLRGRLSVWLGALILGVGTITVALSFWVIHVQAETAQDDALQLIADLLDKDDFHAHTPTLLVSRQRLANVIACRLPNDCLLHLPAGFPEGFHTLRLPQASWRVYLSHRHHAHLLVAQQTALRDELTLSAGLGTLLPLALLIPALAVLAAVVVRRQLRPLQTLGESMRSAREVPERLPDIDAPLELRPFLAAMNELLLREHAWKLVQERFIAMAAHEMRTPLAALALQTDNLGNARDEGQFETRLQSLRAGLRRAQHGAEQLLALSRQQTGDLHPQNLSVPELVHEILQGLLPVAEAHGIALALESDVGACILRTDRLSLQVLLRNVLDNAIRYSPRGSEVVLSLSHADGFLCFSVLDHGPGITEAYREQVFSPFFRIPGSPGPGSGLGLCIVADAARRLGGQIELRQRQPGPGLVFIYRQPLPGKPPSRL